MRITDSIRTVDRNHLIFAERDSCATDFSGLTPAWDAYMAWRFHKTTVVGCQWPVTSRVTLMVYDLLGREVARLIDGVRPAGVYTVRFDGMDLPSGLYFYRLTASPVGGGRTIVRTRAMAFTR